MSLTLTQRTILSLLRPHRTERSWIAGSVVLHGILTREIGDIDIHHATHDEMRTVFDRDINMLKRNGFVIAECTDYRSEIECVLQGPTGEVALNWVDTHDERFLPLEADRELGWRISVLDAVFQKLLMVFDGEERKHFRDLSDCVSSGVLTEGLIRRAAERQSRSDPETYARSVAVGLEAVMGTFDPPPEESTAADGTRERSA